MTREEAIRLLGFLGENWHGLYLQALDMAISALREQGDHIRENTKMVQLPCEVGDVMWGIRTYGGKYVQKKKRPECAKVTEMYFGEGMRLCIVLKGLCRGEYGVTVFGSREEAEAALKEAEDGNLSE